MKASNSKYAQCLYFSSNALARRMEKLATESWKKVELSPSHAYLLMLVLEQPGIQPTGIVQQLQLTPSTITRLMEKLEEKKLLVRTTEGKITNVYPSPKAKMLLPDMQACMHQFAEQCLHIFGKEDVMKFPQHIGRILDKIEE